MLKNVFNWNSDYSLKNKLLYVPLCSLTCSAVVMHVLSLSHPLLLSLSLSHSLTHTHTHTHTKGVAPPCQTQLTVRRTEERKKERNEKFLLSHCTLCSCYDVKTLFSSESENVFLLFDFFSFEVPTLLHDHHISQEDDCFGQK